MEKRPTMGGLARGRVPSIGNDQDLSLPRSGMALVLMLLFFLPAAVPAQFTYTTDHGAITITGYAGAGGEVIIPGTIDGLPVKRIGGGAFSNHTELAGVI